MDGYADGVISGLIEDRLSQPPSAHHTTIDGQPSTHECSTPKRGQRYSRWPKLRKIGSASIRHACTVESYYPVCPEI